MSRWEEVVLKYKFASPPYCREGQDNEEFKQRTHNFEHEAKLLRSGWKIVRMNVHGDKLGSKLEEL